MRGVASLKVNMLDNGGESTFHAFKHSFYTLLDMSSSALLRNGGNERVDMSRGASMHLLTSRSRIGYPTNNSACSHLLQPVKSSFKNHTSPNISGLLSSLQHWLSHGRNITCAISFGVCFSACSFHQEWSLLGTNWSMRITS